MSLPSRLEKMCLDKGLQMTGPRRVIAAVLSEFADHPDVEQVHQRAVLLDKNISIATVYRTVRLFEEAGILERHDFREDKARYEEVPLQHHDHLIDLKTNAIIEFQDEQIERIQKEIAQKFGYTSVDHRLELYGIPAENSEKK